jgi:hypothetical protein
MPPRRIASAALRELIDYDRQCLALERQGEVTLSDDEFFGASHRPPRLHTLDHLPEDWHTLLSLPPALKALEQAKRQAEQVVLFAPIVQLSLPSVNGKTDGVCGNPSQVSFAPRKGNACALTRPTFTSANGSPPR